MLAQLEYFVHLHCNLAMQLCHNQFAKAQNNILHEFTCLASILDAQMISPYSTAFMSIIIILSTSSLDLVGAGFEHKS